MIGAQNSESVSKTIGRRAETQTLYWGQKFDIRDPTLASIHGRLTRRRFTAILDSRVPLTTIS